MPLVVKNTSSITTLVKAGRQLAIKYAVETTSWNRVYLAADVQNSLVKAMEKVTDVPTGAETAILVETEHPSQKDEYPHFTIYYQDKDGKHITTKHVYPAS